MAAADRDPCSEGAAVPTRVVGTSAGGTLETSIAALRPLGRQVAIHERDHSVDRDMEWILAQIRQIDVSSIGF